MSATTALAFIEDYLEKSGSEHPILNKFISPAKDLCMKIRMLAQYSIHANPGSPKMGCDDMLRDSNSNLAATTIGVKVYSYYAFKALWVWLAKHVLVPKFLPKNIVGKLADKFLNICDLVMGRAASTYWNWRRTSMAMTPFSPDGMTTGKVDEANEKIKGAMALFTTNLSPILIHPIATLLNPVLKLMGTSSDNILKQWELDKESLAKKVKDISKEYGVEDKPEELIKSAFSYFQQNIGVLKTGKYTIEGRERNLGDDSPDKEKWYVKSRLLSKIMGLPVGVIGTVGNIFSGGLGIVGELFDHQGMKNWSNQLTAIPTALMSILYTTGEIPAHLNTIIQGLKKGEFRLENLGILTTGILGSFGSFLRPFTDKVKTAFNFFYLFFSWNRLQLHRNDYKQICENATQEQINRAEYYNSFTKHLSMVPKVWLRLKEKITYPTSIAELRERYQSYAQAA